MEPRERLKSVRKELGLTTRGIADALGVGASVYSQWETGQAPVRKPNALAIQALYGYRWEWLMEGEEPKRIEAQVVPPGSDVLVTVVNGLPWIGVQVPLQVTPEPEGHILPRRAMEAILKRCGAGTTADLHLVRVPDDSMRPMMAMGDLVLVNTAVELRRKPSLGTVCLVRVGGRKSESAFFRRVYLHPDRNEPALELVSDAPGLRGRVQPLDGEAVEDQILGVICL